MIAARVATPQQLLPQLLLLLLAPPPVLVAIAGAVAALTPNRRMIAASRMRMAFSPSGMSRKHATPAVTRADAPRRLEGLQ